MKHIVLSFIIAALALFSIASCTGLTPEKQQALFGLAAKIAISRAAPGASLDDVAFIKEAITSLTTGTVSDSQKAALVNSAEARLDQLVANGKLKQTDADDISDFFKLVTS